VRYGTCSGIWRQVQVPAAFCAKLGYAAIIQDAVP